eukprot:TRINITY_DN45513_c0_g1_i3.p1 TRINITY_DN45513_c0_g1~~TRINITY_DN45513_c0_g1_i3.p1  ORF type:complete len:346 (-),score=77.79 TRINITY_DN45513_c0_g1_i3:177-1064(-)
MSRQELITDVDVGGLWQCIAAAGVEEEQAALPPGAAPEADEMLSGESDSANGEDELQRHLASPDLEDGELVDMAAVLEEALDLDLEEGDRPASLNLRGNANFHTRMWTGSGVEGSSGASSSSCSICLMDFIDGQEVTTLLRCGHSFQLPCLKKWMDAPPFSCPMCRDDAAVLDPPAKGAAPQKALRHGWQPRPEAKSFVSATKARRLPVALPPRAAPTAPPLPSKAAYRQCFQGAQHIAAAPAAAVAKAAAAAGHRCAPLGPSRGLVARPGLGRPGAVGLGRKGVAAAAAPSSGR